MFHIEDRLQNCRFGSVLHWFSCSQLYPLFQCLCFLNLALCPTASGNVFYNSLSQALLSLPHFGMSDQGRIHPACSCIAFLHIHLHSQSWSKLTKTTQKLDNQIETRLFNLLTFRMQSKIHLLTDTDTISDTGINLTAIVYLYFNL